MSIFEVQHQPRAHRLLQRALGSHRMPHAYIFAGPPGVGRELMARELARLLLCQQPIMRPLPPELAAACEMDEGRDSCGACDDCRLVGAGTHPDLLLIHRYLAREHPDSTVRQRKATGISVDVIRHFLVDRAGTRPMRGRAKVFIIREAERMNDSAQNALLKTLEEPPGNTTLILVSSSPDALFPTVRSRSQTVAFQTLPAEFVANQTVALRPDADAAAIQYAARHSRGSIESAVKTLDLGLYPIKTEWVRRIAEYLVPPPAGGGYLMAKPFEADAKPLIAGTAEQDEDLTDLEAKRVAVLTLLSAIADFLLDAQRRSAGAGLPEINVDQSELVARVAAGLPPVALAEAIAQLGEAEKALGRFANLELTLENLFVQLGRIANGRTARHVAV